MRLITRPSYSSRRREELVLTLSGESPKRGKRSCNAFSSRLKLFHQLDLLKDVSRWSGLGQDIVSHPVREQPPAGSCLSPPISQHSHTYTAARHRTVNTVESLMKYASVFQKCGNRMGLWRHSHVQLRC